MLKMSWLGIVRSHSRSLKIAPFNRVHTSCYQRSIVTVSLSGTVSELLLVENHRFEPTPLLFGAPMGVIPSEFRRDLRRKKTKSPWIIVQRCSRDPVFSPFGTAPA